ncbi:TPA: hypothetical protein N0F65_008127 [Lagenidium giganteum]|uniref:YdbS-like PH domain-containing protein n=1 Tax=Lagenidium giganteum TaxID=4803 RepID=A0AAV2YWD2_9STRA|nr:TPA: hypothetical protein N0F65_008127 [Lagenidium giganteum]
MCYCCCVWPLWTTGLSCLLLPCVPYWQHRKAHSQKCQITDKRIIFESGWLNHTSKSIPIDRIQDVNVDEGCIQRMCGIKSVGIQTAGSGSQEAEATLQAPLDIAMVRELVLHRRDRLVHGMAGSATGGGVDDMKGQASLMSVSAKGTHVSATGANEVVLELRQLRETVQRIEGQIQVGLKRMD